LFTEKMYVKNVLWIALVFLFHLFSWYMIMCFFAIYVNSNLGWIYGTALSVIIDALIVQITYSLVKSISRELARKCSSSVFTSIYKAIKSLLEKIQ
jgi:hypothetical protein